MAQELLQKVRSGAKQGSINLEDVEEILSNADFTDGEGLLATTGTDNENTLLHLAAASKDSNVLPLVSQAYKRAKFFSQVMQTPNAKDLTPIHISIRYCRFDNVILLYKDCQELCPEALEPNEKGLTLFHSALENCENLNMVKFFLSQEKCLPMLLCSYKASENVSALLPLDMAKSLVHKHEYFVKSSEAAVKNSSRPMSDTQYNISVGPKKKALEKAKELLSLIEQPTLELKAEESKRQAKRLEEQKFLERQGQLNLEIEALLQADDWQAIEEKYLLAEIEETRKISVMYLAGKLGAEGFCVSLPALSEQILKVLMNLLLKSSESGTVLATLKLLSVYAGNVDNNKVIVELEGSLPLLREVVDILCSSALEDNLQTVCAEVLANFFNNQPPDYPTELGGDESGAVQPLLLVRHFSLWEEAKRLAGEALRALKVDLRKEPDPGTWTVQQVSFWLSSCKDIESSSEYSRKFSDAGIDGLHLLELSSAEMTGLGVKFVSQQRKLMALIDDLRRRNMRSMVGKRDVFLSYAHRNIKFARKIKKALNDENYTVWIDEAGIRAGHKWRNEIADGIQSAACFLVILTARSAISEYCQDEVGLAEEYHKPIITVRREEVTEMDPGLKLTLQRRQWLDFLSESSFEEGRSALIEAIHSIVGEGSGPEPDYPEADNTPVEDRDLTHIPKVASPSPVSVPPGMGGVAAEDVKQLVLEVVREELERFREEVMTEISQLDRKLDDLTRRIDMRYY